MSRTLALLISWGGPPLLGALIGYVVSRIAAGLLLRRAAGPGTPGSPRGGASPLSRAISGLISRELLSEDRLRSSLGTEESARALGRTVSVLTEGILSLPAADILGSFPPGPALTPEELATRAVKRLLASPGLIAFVRKTVSRAVNALGAIPMADVLAAVKLESLVTDRLIPRLSGEPGRSTLSRSIAVFAAGQAEGLVSDEVLDEIPRLLAPLVPDAVDGIVRWLRAPETRSYLSDQGRELLPRLLEKLNVLQKLFLSAAQYDRRLTEQMPEIVDETILSLERMARDPAQQRRILELVRGMARDWRDSLRVHRVENGRELENEARRELEGSVSRLMDRILAAGEDPARRSALYAELVSALRVDRQTLGGFIRQAAGITDADLVDALCTALLTWLAREGTAEVIGAAAASALPGIKQDSPLRDTLYVDADCKGRLDARIASWLQRMIPAAVPELMKSVDVEALVSRALGGTGGLARAGASLRQRACAFGALMGLVIGLFQLLLRCVPVG